MTTKHKQCGYSMVAMVMVLLSIGTLLLTSMSKRLDSSLHFHLDEGRYLRAYNQAASALTWGLKQRWHLPDAHWQCQISALLGLKACIKTVEQGRLLLKGEAKLRENEPPLTLFQLADLADDAANPNNNNLVSYKLAVIAHNSGWLDFCPSKEEMDCL